MPFIGIEQPCVEPELITQQEKTFRVGIKSSQRIDVFRKPEFRQGSVKRFVGGEAGEHSVRLMKSNQHRPLEYQGLDNCTHISAADSMYHLIHGVQ